MIRFKARILQFADQGEKSGWTYIRIPSGLAQELKPGNRKTFRVRGKLDDHVIGKLALLPMGEGDFILALNAGIRKAIRKQQGATVDVQLEVDDAVIRPPEDLMECLADEPSALAFFKGLAGSHQNYFGNWVRSAKTDGTRTRRIAQIVNALARSRDFGEMIRELKAEKGKGLDRR